MMEIKDDRSEEERATHTELIVMRDSFMTGQGGASYAAWACLPEHSKRVLEWVQSRSDAKNVRVRGSNYVPRGEGHYHVYVVSDGHSSLRHPLSR